MFSLRYQPQNQSKRLFMVTSSGHGAVLQKLRKVERKVKPFPRYFVVIRPHPTPPSSLFFFFQYLFCIQTSFPLHTTHLFLAFDGLGCRCRKCELLFKIMSAKSNPTSLGFAVWLASPSFKTVSAFGGRVPQSHGGATGEGRNGHRDSMKRRMQDRGKQ